MRLCTDCWHITTGKPLYCNRCGSSYNVKLCPRHHSNPRAAKACSQCGSSELSRAQGKPRLVLRPLLVLFGIGPGYLLIAAFLVYAFLYVRELVRNPAGLLPLMCIGLVLGLLLFTWMCLPGFMKSGVRKTATWFTRRKGR